MARHLILGLAAVVAAVSSAHAMQGATPQAKPLQFGDSVTATGTIQAIDATLRLVTIRSDDGAEETVYVGPEVKRFDEIKVGDKIKLRYYESVVLQLRKPGEASTPPSDETKLTANKANVGATLGRQVNMTVSVVAVDMKTPSIAVKTSDGRMITRKVQDAKNLQGVSPGDRIDITYTQGVAVDLDRVK